MRKLACLVAIAGTANADVPFTSEDGKFSVTLPVRPIRALFDSFKLL